MPLPTRLQEFGPPMWRRASCSPIRATFMALFLGLFAGCSDEDNPTAPETPRNPDLPNANAMVRYHRIDGDTAKRSSIYDLIDFLGDRVEDYRTKFGVSNRLSRMEREVSETDTFRDSVAALSETVDSFEALSSRGNRRKRF